MGNIKKILLSVIILLTLTGCNINNMEIDEVIDIGANRKVDMHNQYRSGYKYYVPLGMKNLEYDDYNERLSDGENTYYLYIDAVSYLNKAISEYEENEEAYYSSSIDFEDKFGYLEINKLENEQYIVEIMYNYAKIETIVDEGNINVVVLNSLNVLSSVEFDDEILQSLIGENVLEFKETEFNILKPKEDSNYLRYREETELENNYEDSDIIN